MTALSERGLSQTLMGAAVDTWRQQILLDVDLTVFHGGTVDLLQEPPVDYVWDTNFAMGVFPVGIDETDLKIGTRSRLLQIVTGFYWIEVQKNRQPGEAGIEDLERLWDAAIWANEQLRWGLPSDTPAWPSVPPGSAATPNQIIARKLSLQVPTLYAEFVDEQGRTCGQRIAEFAAVYEIPFPNC